MNDWLVSALVFSIGINLGFAWLALRWRKYWREVRELQAAEAAKREAAVRREPVTRSSY